MEVKVIEPCGCCLGVHRAIELAKKTRLDNPTEKVTVLGMLAHNRHVIQELEELDIFFEPVINFDYVSALNKIKEGFIIFSAHGHDKSLEDLAKERGLKVVDTTCPYVSKTFIKIEKVLKEGNDVIYIGKRKHPEAIAALSISPNIVLYDIDQNKLLTSAPLYSPVVFNQTTVSYDELHDIHQHIMEMYPTATILDEMCSTSRLRQHGIDTIEDDVTLIFVIGDDMSNNTESLYRLAKLKHPHANVYKISCLGDIKHEMIKEHQKVALISGASTPQRIVEEIANYLKIK